MNGSNGDTKNYHFGTKNNWRRTVWNEVLRRTEGREKQYPILYLAGPEDLDRKIALSKGVPDQNLIAVDRSEINVKAIRKLNRPAIDSDVLNLMWSWPEDKPVAAVLLDFCSGITVDNIAVYDPLARKPFRKAIIMVNFMRGRDPWSNQLRDQLEQLNLLQPLWKTKMKDGVIIGEPEIFHSDTKHRAFQFLMFHAFDTVVTTNTGGYSAPGDGKDRRGARRKIDYADTIENRAMIGNLLCSMNPKFFNYKSGHLTFDSAVFNHALYILNFNFDDPGLDQITARFKDLPLVRKLAALFAVRTKRNNHVSR